MNVRKVQPTDRAEWIRMRTALWPEEPDDHPEEIDAFFAGFRGGTVFVAEVDGRLVGFLELGRRDYAEGCLSSPVAYVEGWWVDPEHRGSGVGRALVEAAMEWARAEDFEEMASDAELGNTGSQDAHRALGFEEVERVVCYRRSL